jgi:hypothetical protein
MNNMKRTDRTDPLTRTVVDDALTTTPGKMAITYANQTALGTDVRGSSIGHAHFDVGGTTQLPCRYINIGCVATGDQAASVVAFLIIQFWHSVAAQWQDSAPMQILGVTGLDGDQVDVGGLKIVKVPRGATKGRAYLRGLAVDQGVDLTVDPDNDD